MKHTRILYLLVIALLIHLIAAEEPVEQKAAPAVAPEDPVPFDTKSAGSEVGADWLERVWSQVDEQRIEKDYPLQEVVTVAGVRG